MKKGIAICLILLTAFFVTAQKITAFKDKTSGKIGFKQNGETIIPATKYDGWDGYSEGLIAVSNNDKWGFIDFKGVEVIELTYFFVSTFHEGFALVSLKRGKFGYIDKAGTKITEFVFQNGRPFYEGFAAVEQKDKYGFIDAKGTIIVDYKYQEAFQFKEGMAAVKFNDKWGFIDKDAKEVVDFKYGESAFFSEGFASVSTNGKYTFIDKTGKEIIEPKYDYISFFSSGLAKFSLDSKYGFIDVNGTEIIKPIYQSVTDFKGGFAKIVYRDASNFSMCKYIDKTGKYINNKDYSSTSEDFFNGFAIVVEPVFGRKGVIDQTGKEILETKYVKVNYSSVGFTVQDENGLVLRFDKEGKSIN
jgi:hypothetical protein